MFAIRNLGVLNYSVGFTSWVYKIGDEPLSRVKAPGYFNDARDMLAVGDVIVVVSTEGTTMISVRTRDDGVSIAPLVVL